MHRAKKGKREEAITALVTAGASLVNTEEGENGLQDSEILAPGEFISGVSECNTGGEVTYSNLAGENGLQDSEIPAPGVKNERTESHVVSDQREDLRICLDQVKSEL